MIEYAWHGTQSVFDAMLATGVLLVPIGILGAVISIVDTTSDASAASVLAIVAFHLATGWRTLKLAEETPIDLGTG